VISVQSDVSDSLKTYIVHQDVELAEGMVRAPAKRHHGQDEEPIFWPDDELGAGADLTLEANELSEAKLKKLGK